MSDNITAPATGAVLATDDIGGIQYPRTKISLGADGAAIDAIGGAGVVSAAVLRVTHASDDPAVTLLTAQGAYLDGLESGISGLNTLLTTQNGYLDTVETLIGSTNTLLTTHSGYLDGVETALGTLATQTTLAAVNTKLPASLGAKAHGASLSVASAGLEYETVAASQTAQAMGATGATGDYLSHVIVQPTSTAPGVVTVLDNAIEVHAYPGGTVGADLTPIVLPIGAFSVSGAWKITTGANVKITAYGDFT